MFETQDRTDMIGQIRQIMPHIKDSRAKVIEGIHKAMKHIDDDELLELSMRVAGKLESIGDEEYAGLVLEAAE